MAKGSVTPSWQLQAFGSLLTLPLKALPAGRGAGSEWDNVHVPCNGKLNILKKCSVCMTVADEAAVMKMVRGITKADGSPVLLTDAQIKAATVTSSKVMIVQTFVNMNEVDPIWLDKSHYLGPADPAISKTFQLFRGALERSGTAAFVKYADRGHDKIGLVRAMEDCLMLHELFWPEEIEPFKSKNRVQILDVSISESEMNLACTLIEEALSPFDPTGQRDRYQDNIEALVEAARNNAALPVLPTTQEPQATTADDLTSLLSQALAAQRATTTTKKPVAKVEDPKPEAKPKRSRKAS